MSKISDPATPPSTGPTSPTSPTSANALIDDCEKGIAPDSQHEEWNEKSAVPPNGHYTTHIEWIAIFHETDQKQTLPSISLASKSQHACQNSSQQKTPLVQQLGIGQKMEGQSSSSEVRNCAGPSHAFADAAAVEDHPEGYPQVAAFINSDDNFLIARKFGFLRSRSLLYCQDELTVLERELRGLDAEDKEKDPKALQSRRHDEKKNDDPDYSRKALMRKIKDKLKEYGKRSHPAKNRINAINLLPPRRFSFSSGADTKITRILISR